MAAAGPKERGVQRTLFPIIWSALGLRPRVTVNGRGGGRLRQALENTRHTALETLTPTVVVRDGDRSYAFRATSYTEFKRAARMLVREEGTIAWLRSELRPDDVVYDIGANIGVFTLFAAARLETGIAYAFEPHLVNASHLLVNVHENGFDDVVRVISSPVWDSPGVVDFDYDRLSAGSAFSHVGSEPAGRGRTTELKVAVTVDELLDRGALRPADLVKLDVDGGELQVLSGMRGLLSGERRPRAIQVEVNEGPRGPVPELLSACGYDLVERHHSVGGRRLLESGADPDEVPFNGIFRPRAG